MKNLIQRTVGRGIILTIVTIIVGVLLLRNAINMYNELDAETNEVIGTQIIINSDTLLVTDYNFLENHYVLSDGTQISTKLLDDLEVLP